MNKYLARLKAQSPQKCPGDAHSKSSKLNFEDFDSAQPRHVLPEIVIPHPRYGHDEFSPIRLPHPAIITPEQTPPLAS